LADRRNAETVRESFEDFLEPVYLNEKMVLNCAAYIFKGYSLESEAREQAQSEGSKSLTAGISFLERLISLGGEAQSKHSEISENRSARRYTVGGLHMSLVDELHARGMLQAIRPDDLAQDLGGAPSYVEMPATLRPIDFYALVDTLRIASPIVAEVFKSFVGPWYEQRRKRQWLQQKVPQQPATAPRHGQQQRKHARSAQHLADGFQEPDLDNSQIALKDLDNYVVAAGSVLKQLEDDYRRSKQIEMVMWSADDNPRPYGVVDLDLADYEPEELRAKLAGGTFRVVGKLVL
jgi:hypothetical protein